MGVIAVGVVVVVGLEPPALVADPPLTGPLVILSKRVQLIHRPSQTILDLIKFIENSINNYNSNITSAIAKYCTPSVLMKSVILFTEKSNIFNFKHI
jgi:hypothetical protein